MPNNTPKNRPPPESLEDALIEIDVLKRRVERERLARKEAEDLSEHAMRVAVEDPLTKLANRTMVNDQLKLEIEIAKRRQSKVLVLYLDLDSFKTVNDTYGHETGDAVLCHAANVLKKAMRPEDIVGRLGGDEFVVITAGVPEAKADWFIQRLHQTLKESPLEINGIKLPLRASIGAAAVDGDTTTDDALHRADTAMYHAKKSLFTHCRMFDEKLARADQRRRHILRNLPNAVAENQLILHYQPIINTHTGYIEQVEALVRWQCDGEILQPEMFIPVAEESGFINEIGRYILEKSLLDITQWRKKTSTDKKNQPSVAINISPKQLLDPSFAQTTLTLLKKYNLNADAISLEITETTLLGKDEMTFSTLSALSDAGHQLALDDFGTGHSSLTILRAFQFHTVKIDRSFIDESATNQENEAIIQAMNTVAHTLGAKTVAEGIEDQAQLRSACLSGFDFAQGFALSKALPAEQIETLFNTHFDMPAEQLDSEESKTG